MCQPLKVEILQADFCIIPFNSCCFAVEKMARRHFASAHMQVGEWFRFLSSGPLEKQLEKLLWANFYLLLLLPQSSQNLKNHDLQNKKDFLLYCINRNSRERHEKKFLMCNEALIFQHFCCRLLAMESGFRVCGKLGHKSNIQKLDFGNLFQNFQL